MSLPLFVYGSLRDPRVRARLLGRDTNLATRPAILRGHARQMVPDFGYPFVVAAAPESQVDGEVLLGLQTHEYAILDAYEDVDEGLYVRVRVSVETPDGALEAWTYLKGPTAPGPPPSSQLWACPHPPTPSP
jgi:gamma-glutamylcyclotransferase (GGCT)/AIG2-like uncharacterized protein YtfP